MINGGWLFDCRDLGNLIMPLVNVCIAWPGSNCCTISMIYNTRMAIQSYLHIHEDTGPICMPCNPHNGANADPAHRVMLPRGAGANLLRDIHER